MAVLSKPRSLLILVLLMILFILFRFIHTRYSNVPQTIARRISVITYSGFHSFGGETEYDSGSASDSDFVESDVDFMSLPELPIQSDGKTGLDKDKKKNKNKNKDETFMGFGGVPFNITKESDFRTLEELKEMVGFQCPSIKHCSMWPRTFLKGGMWSIYDNDNDNENENDQGLELGLDELEKSSGIGTGTRRVFNPFNCWWYQFVGDEQWLRPLSTQNVGIFLDASQKNMSLFAGVSRLEPRLKYMRTRPTLTKEGELDELVMRVQKAVDNGPSVHLSVFTNVRGIDAKGIYEALKLLQSKLEFASTRVFWVNQHFVSRDTVDSILGLNHRMSLLFNNEKVEGLRYIDVFAPSLFAPERADMHKVLPEYLRVVALNYIFQRRILQRATRPKPQHICKTKQSCSSCFMVPSKLPSSRLTFRLISNYFTRYGTPTVISISDHNRVWSGTWQDFAGENGNTTLKVRLNYETVRSRRYRRISIRKYLHLVGILQSPVLPSHAVPSIDSTLPLYAGNNKLSPEAMRNFKFRYPPWFAPKSLQSPSMWLGPKDSVSSLHVDHGNKGNLAYQVLGSKLWHLFSPAAKQFAFLVKIGPVYWSRIADPREYHPQTNQHRFKFAIANSMKIRVKEGEMLFNPDQWGHAVYNTNASLMLNFWLRNARLKQAPKRKDFA